MRDYSHFDGYYDELSIDVYPQPPSEWHLAEMRRVIDMWCTHLDAHTVLDVGCGRGEAQDVFEAAGMAYHGVARGQDIVDAKELNKHVVDEDFNFLGYGENSFDLIFSRHSLEHSPFPLLTLMDWHRVSTKWLCLVVPNPEHHTFVGRNHYSVMTASQVAWILRRAGWKYRKAFIGHREFWFLCTKENRIGYEGWAEAPLANPIYEFERELDKFKGLIDADEFFKRKDEEFEMHKQRLEKMKRRGKI